MKIWIEIYLLKYKQLNFRRSKIEIEIALFLLHHQCPLSSFFALSNLNCLKLNKYITDIFISLFVFILITF